MCDQGNIMEFVRNEEEDSNSDYGSLSPGTLSWLDHAWSEFMQGQIEHPIHFDSQIPIPVAASPSNYMDMMNSFNTQASFPEFNVDSRFLDSQGCFPSLKRLELQNCQGLPELPERGILSLIVLQIQNFQNLHEHPGWIQYTSSLRVLKIQNCQKLSKLPDWIQNISSLEVLKIQNCQKLTELQDWIENISSLEVLKIQNCQKLTELPDWIENISSFEVLETQNCQKLTEILDWILNLSSLSMLEIHNSEYFSNLSRLCFPAATTDSLEYPSHPIFEKNNSLHLVMEAELAFSFRNIMNSAIQYALSQACSSSKSNHNGLSFVTCEGENKLFLAQPTKSGENGYQSIQSFIPCGSSSEFSPCRVASVVYILYLFEALNEDFTILGSMFNITTSFRISSFKFSYHAEHSSPGHAQGYHLHATLSMSLLVCSENSPLGLFEIVHCPCKASFPSKHHGGPGPNKKRQSVLSPYVDSTMRQGSSKGRQKLLDSVQSFTYSAHASCKSLEVIARTQTNNQHKRKESTTTWSTYGLISLQDLEQHYGMKREEAAESLQVSVSTFKRICRKHGILRWPSAKRKRDNSVLSSQKHNVSLQVACSPNAFLSALQPFSSSSTVESHPESSLCSSPSRQREGNPSDDHNMLGSNETTKENNMSQGRALAEESRQCKASNGSLSVESLMPDALVKTSQPPQNGITCEDSETSSRSSQKRKRLEKETDCMNEVTHFEEQPSEIQNGNPKRQAIGFANKGSSCLGSISGTIEGNNKAYNRNSKSITGYDVVDDMDYAYTGVQLIVGDADSTCMGVQPKDDTSSTRMEVQPPLESISTLSLNSFSCNENTALNIKLHFDNLIALPLKDLINPENETSMMKALSILADNLSLFSEQQAEQILGLSFDFPGLLNSWREYSRSQIYSQKSFAEMDKIQDLVETSVNDEESLKVRYEELEMKEKELMAQLEAVQKEKASIAEQMHEKCKQIKYLLSLAEEKAASRTKEKHMMKLATTKLNNLVDQWTRIQSFFM